MAMTCEPEIERFQYWEGQRLRSRDFRDQIAVEAQLRWWHNRALHGVFGVRYGFHISEVVEGGSLGPQRQPQCRRVHMDAVCRVSSSSRSARRAHQV